MSVLLVLVAHNGKTLQLDVSPGTRVEAVQQALVSVTGVSVSDQIVMCHGARLDPAKPLAAYKLPAADPGAAEDCPVFLYHKGFLRPGAPPPPPEPLPLIEVAVASLPPVGLRHPLHSAHSPLIRALPDYEAQFEQQLGEARAVAEASQQRLARCRQLMSEQEVQARAADAARANVEAHYGYIASAYAAFVDKYVAQHRAHAALLAQFAGLAAALAGVELPPQLATPRWRVLADLQPRSRLAEWHDSCSRSHEQFAQKVSELEGVFQLLRGDVEALFLTAPSVDLDALGAQLGEAEGRAAEQASIVQVLAKDLTTVRTLVEDVVAQLGASAGGASLAGAAVHDTAAAVDSMHDTHHTSLLPRVRGADAAIAEFTARCGAAKARMTGDVLQQLQGIAAQQSRIRDMKHKLGLFNEVLARQAAAFGQLAAATRLPAAYRLALAECCRRAAWREMFAGQAARLAEHCGRITAKEAARREAVGRQLERHLPQELLAAAGLLQEPPHCSVAVPPAEGFLLPVSPADLARLPAVIQQAADAAAAAEQQQQQDAASSARLARTSSSDAAAAAAGGGEGGGQPHAAASSMAASAWLSRPDGPSLTSLTSPSAAAVPGGSLDLALENARLRAELASLLAQAAARELAGDGGSSSSSGGAAAAAAGRGGVGASMMMAASQVVQQQQQQPGSSISLAASAAGAQQQQQQQQPGAADSEAAAAAARPYGHGGPAVVPPGVAAPLPAVSAALAEAAAGDGSEAAAAAARQALTLAPVQAALAAKDELVAALEATVSRHAAALAAYERRIAELEAQVAAAAAAGGSGAAAGAGGISQRQQEEQEEQEQQQEAPGAAGSSGLVGASSGSAAAQVASAAAAAEEASVSVSTAEAAVGAPGVDNAQEQHEAASGPVEEQQQQQKLGAEQKQPVASPAAAGGGDDAAPGSEQQEQQPAAPLQGAVSAASSSHSASSAAATHSTASSSTGALPEPQPQQQEPQQLRSAPPSVAAASAAPAPAAGAAGGAALSVSEPDLRCVMVAGPAAVQADRQQQQQQGRGRPDRISADGSGMATAAAGAGAVAGGAAGGGLSGLLTSSMQYLFHRTSSGGGGSSRADSGSRPDSASPGSPAASPPMSPPAAAAAAAAAEAAAAAAAEAAAAAAPAHQAEGGVQSDGGRDA